MALDNNYVLITVKTIEGGLYVHTYCLTEAKLLTGIEIWKFGNFGNFISNLINIQIEYFLIGLEFVNGKSLIY